MRWKGYPWLAAGKFKCQPSSDKTRWKGYPWPAAGKCGRQAASSDQPSWKGCPWLAAGKCEGFLKRIDEVEGFRRWEFSLLAKSRLNQLNWHWSALVEGVSE